MDCWRSVKQRSITDSIMSAGNDVNMNVAEQVLFDKELSSVSDLPKLLVK